MTYSTNKCLYDLPPFDQHFDPQVHNKYLSRWDPADPRPPHSCQRKYFRKAKLLERQARRDEKSPSLDVLLRQNKSSSNYNGKFTYKKCLLETVIIGNHWSCLVLKEKKKVIVRSLCFIQPTLIYSLIFSIPSFNWIFEYLNMPRSHFTSFKSASSREI